MAVRHVSPAVEHGHEGRELGESVLPGEAESVSAVRSAAHAVTDGPAVSWSLPTAQ